VSCQSVPIGLAAEGMQEPFFFYEALSAGSAQIVVNAWQVHMWTFGDVPVLSRQAALRPRPPG
jgi:hypothetical protein